MTVNVVPHFSTDAWRYVFNTPLECGLRCTALLIAAYPAPADLQKLVQWEYLLVHSGDVDGGPESLHPATPNRAGELLVRRSLIERGLLFMMSRQVICRRSTPNGLVYVAGDWALSFLDSLESPYTQSLRARAVWVIERFSSLTDSQLDSYMRTNWSHWGSEFSRTLFNNEDSQ